MIVLGLQTFQNGNGQKKLDLPERMPRKKALVMIASTFLIALSTSLEVERSLAFLTLNMLPERP